MRAKSDTRVVVLNATMEPLAVVPLSRALTFLIRERATIVEARAGETIRSATAEFPVPLVVAFRELVRVPFRWTPEPWSRRGVLSRDNRECAYCGRVATTIDHVTPKSRGGGNTWLNTVAACSRCNNIKDDRTPKEAGMDLRYQPREVTRRDTLIVAAARLGADLTSLGLA
jgi:5-methylcytosine-specific restriction endonuclease McrA